MSAHALVVGRFCPPHAGHHLVIDRAAAAADRVTVLALGRSDEALDPELRAAWLRERHPGAVVVPGVCDLPTHYDDPEVFAAHEAVIRGLLDEPVDLVVSSEWYGERLASRMGAEHLMVDPARAAVPVSATAIREDLAAHWWALEPPVRAHLARRVAIVGAESTGTTTLTRALAERRGAAWVPEYGRTCTEELVAAGTAIDAIAWDDEAFERIAARQAADEDAAAHATLVPLVFCDTDPLATCVWQERYLGRSTPAVEAIAAARRYELYVLTGDDVPFEQDGLRDGEHVRGWMTQRFRERLAERPEPWIEVRGPLEERIAAVEAALS